jgi:hypothetical protein
MIFKVGDKYTWYNGDKRGVPFGENKVTIVRVNPESYIVELEGKPFSRYGGLTLTEDELIGRDTPQIPTPAEIPAPILAAYRKWLTGGFDPVIIARAIETWLKENGR